MQRPWRDVSYWPASPGLLSLLSYRTQDLVEVNPHLATSEEEAKATANLAVDVIASSFGQTRGGGGALFWLCLGQGF